MCKRCGCGVIFALCFLLSFVGRLKFPSREGFIDLLMAVWFAISCGLPIFSVAALVINSSFRKCRSSSPSSISSSTIITIHVNPVGFLQPHPHCVRARIGLGPFVTSRASYVLSWCSDVLVHIASSFYWPPSSFFDAIGIFCGRPQSFMYAPRDLILERRTMLGFCGVFSIVCEHYLLVGFPTGASDSFAPLRLVSVEEFLGPAVFESRHPWSI